MKAVIFETARMVGILITFMQIATSTQEIFSGVTFPVNLLVYLKVMGFVNLDFLSLVGIECDIDVDHAFQVVVCDRRFGCSSRNGMACVQTLHVQV